MITYVQRLPVEASVAIAVQKLTFFIDYSDLDEEQEAMAFNVLDDLTALLDDVVRLGLLRAIHASLSAQVLATYGRLAGADVGGHQVVPAVAHQVDVAQVAIDSL